MYEENFIMDKTDISGIRFRKWFGKSLVKNKENEPLVVYHGSGAKFEEFDISKIADSNGRSEGAGFYFTDDDSIAKGYQRDTNSSRESGKFKESGSLYAVYLKIEKPITFDQKPFTRAQVTKIVKRVAKIESEEDGMHINDGFLANYGYIPDEGMVRVVNNAVDGIMNDDNVLDQLGGLVGSGLTASQVNQAVYETLGYDGYVANGFDNRGEGGGTIWIAMFPNQIKSIYNKGKFNPKSDNMMESLIEKVENLL